VYHTYNVTPLQEIAKQQAIEDMHMALLFNGNAEIPIGIDWSTCFDVSNITDECDEPLHYHHDGCPSCSQIRVAV